MKKNKLLYQTNDWTTESIQNTWNVIDKIAREELGLNYYPPQIELITFDQMLDAYSSIGLPIMYNHWSFGKSFIETERAYKAGEQGLAYEMVINSNPAIAYCLETNTSTMQALVMAHASCLTGETEFLTPTGWKRIDEYKEGDLVAQYTAEGAAEFVKPLRYIHNTNNTGGIQKFLNIETQGIKQEVTLDHKMVLLDQYKNLTTMSAEEFHTRQMTKTRGYNGYFITGFNLCVDTELPYSLSEIALAVAIKADGSIRLTKVVDYNFCRFHLKKARKIKRLCGLLNLLHIEFKLTNTYGGGVSITFKCNKKYTKSYDARWFQASPRQLEVIATEVLHWDGSLNSHSFSAKELKEVEYIQYVWAARGHHTHISQGTRCWRVTYANRPYKGISKSGNDSRASRDNFEYSFKWNSYCFTVPSGMFVTRNNLKISVTGNCGHVHFFKNNYMFKEWTDADSILPYMKYAKEYVDKCSEKYGSERVELLLDSCHAIQDYGVDLYKRGKKKTADEYIEQEIERLKFREAHHVDSDDIYPGYYAQGKLNKFVDQHSKGKGATKVDFEDLYPEQYKSPRGYPEENLLYFLEKRSPILFAWEREILRIVRNIAQYFYPQRLTKVMNEGFATAIHYTIMTMLYDRGYISEGNMFEFLHSHTNVCCQRDLTAINPYTLGFSIFMDLKRMCLEPTDEDREYFPNIAGSKDWLKLWKDCVANYRDESFILQFLSPKVVRDLKLFSIRYDDYLIGKDKYYEVNATHKRDDFEALRRILANEHTLDHYRPYIQISGVDWIERELLLTYEYHDNKSSIKFLDDDRAYPVIEHIQRLWGFGVDLEKERNLI